MRKAVVKQNLCICKICGNERVDYLYGLCQNCYNEQRLKYKHRKLKQGVKIEKIERETHRKILRLYLYQNCSYEKIAEMVGLTVRMVNYVVNKYCDYCDKYGNLKPKEFQGKYHIKSDRYKKSK